MRDGRSSSLYGTGLRMSECVRLDLSDVDLSQGLVLVRDGRGRKDRLLPLAGRARAALSLYTKVDTASLAAMLRRSHPRS